MKYLSLLLIGAIIAAGCSTSRITNTWKEQNVTAKPYKKVLVLGLSGEPDRNFREKMEEHMVGDLRDLGYNAVSAIAQYGPKTFEGLKEKEAVQQLNEQGFDAVITIVLLDKEKERYYTPARVNYSPYGRYHRQFWNYYSTIYGRVSSSGYYSESTKYFWESNLYDLTDWIMIYSAQSQSFDPTSASTLGHEYGLMIVKDMVKQNVLKKQTATAPALKSF
jgi:hypothetical protein